MAGLYMGDTAVHKVMFSIDDVPGAEDMVAGLIDRSITNIVFPDDMTEVLPRTFMQCVKLNFDSLPNEITVIGERAFALCTKLSLSTLPANLVEIQEYAFTQTDITITSIPASVQTIGVSAFRYCRKIESLVFEGTPTSIDSTAFANTTALTEIFVPWAEGEVANAPWGATNATITYNYQNGGTA